jgi:histidine triad (HIT) family protein
MTDCLFCDIAQKKKEEKIIYEDDLFVAFYDANPQAPIHLLIIPKEHVSVTGCDIKGRCNVSCKLFSVARKIAEMLKIEGSYKLLLNAGYSASKAPDHLHVHLLGGWESPTETRSM